MRKLQESQMKAMQELGEIFTKKAKVTNEGGYNDKVEKVPRDPPSTVVTEGERGGTRREP